MSISVYVEGGGKRDGDVNSRCREGFSEYLRKVAPDQPKAKVIACGGRAHAFQMFRTALAVAKEGQICALLVDSEAPITPGHSPKQHLQGTPDRWDFTSVDSSNIFLMVQAMEAWFLADRVALAAFYGRRFRSNALPGNERDVESILKDDLEPAIIQATRDTSKGKYDKPKHAFAILARIDPRKVEQGSQHALALHVFLRGVDGGVVHSI